MYLFARKRQRKRLQTELSITYSYLAPLLSEGQYLGPLRRIGETLIQPEAEFVTVLLPHSELLLCVLEGRLEVGNTDGPLHEMEAGDVYRIAAVEEAELTFKNPSAHKKNRVLELWLSADLPGPPPEPEGVRLNANQGFFNFLPLASGQGHEDAAVLTTECAVYLSRLRPSDNLIFETVLSRSVYVFVLDGAVRLENDRLIGGDSALVFGEERIPMSAQQQSAVILIDLPLGISAETDHNHENTKSTKNP
jgi:redox-sensitive bicupin YhaK (pirin superfamily)